MSTWQDLVTAGLIGTERAAVPLVAIPGLPALPGAPPDIPFPDNPTPDSPAPGNPTADSPGPDRPAPDDPAALLLDSAALLTVARRAGRPPGRAEPLPAAEPDPAPVVSLAAGRRLARILGGEQPDLLAEWLAAAVARGRRIPAQLLPGLLDRARRVSPSGGELRRLAAQAGGSRARWLAGLNPAWKFLLAETLTVDDAWRLGDAAQRRGYLAALRARDPGAATELIADSWAAAGPDERVMFVSVLADGLNLADEPLLETALNHGDARARKMAADMLAALPGSALSQRMGERARPCLQLDRGVRGTRLLVSPPAECDAAMRRDGIIPGPGGGPPLAERARLLLEVVARAPLRTWTDGFGITPAEIVRVRSGDWAPVLVAGWSRAAVAQGKQDRGAWAWVAPLIRRSVADGRPGMTFDAGTLGQLARRADPALGAPGALPDLPPDAPPVLREAVAVLRFRYHMMKELDVDHRDD